MDLAAEMVVAALRAAGCVAPEEEAAELMAAATAAAAGGVGGADLADLLERRRTGEPLAWIVGSTPFCGLRVPVRPGVYVPRWQTEFLAHSAVEHLPPAGLAVDLGTGAGAIPLVLAAAYPQATVIGTEISPEAAACARANGVTVYEGHLDRPLPEELRGQVDVMTGVLPYVPDGSVELLPRDVQRWEPRRALLGGPTGLDLVTEAVGRAPRWLRPNGWLLMEVGVDQVETLRQRMAEAGFESVGTIRDGDGDPCGAQGCLGQPTVATATG